jgi:hypothetical protein
MVSDLYFLLKMRIRFHSYLPKKVTPRSVWLWLRQFSQEERAALCKAAEHLLYVPEKVFIEQMVEQNKALLNKLKGSGVPLSKIIYVSVGEAGSSSHAVLNVIRDRCQLQSLGCKFADGRSYDALSQLTGELGSGVIIYVDDFAGTGDQFCNEQEQLGSYILGNFSQYFLMHTVCKEALFKIDGNGVVPWQHSIHAKRDRPLHENSTILNVEERNCLIQLCHKISKGKPGSLGDGDLAVSIVFYRNIPTNAPRIFQGDTHQKKFHGLVPRTTDLPKPGSPERKKNL